MTSVQNPVVLLRKVIAQIKGVEKREEWELYFVVAALSMVIALLFMVHYAFLEEKSIATVSGQQHIVLPMEKIEIAPKKIAPVQEDQRPIQSQVAEKEQGEWCYDEVYQEWRYKK